MIWGILATLMINMKPMLLICFILLSALCCIQAVDGQVVENGYGIVRGSSYAFTLKAPSGWVIDAASGVEQGLPSFEQLVASYAFQKEKIPVDSKDLGFFQDGTPKD